MIAPERVRELVQFARRNTAPKRAAAYDEGASS